MKLVNMLSKFFKLIMLAFVIRFLKDDCKIFNCHSFTNYIEGKKREHACSLHSFCCITINEISLKNTLA